MIRPPLPISGRHLVDALDADEGRTREDLLELCRDARETPDAVSRWTRALVPVVVALICVGVMVTVFSVGRDTRMPTFGVSTDDQALFNGLVEVSRLQQAGVPETDPERHSFEVYLAARYMPLSSRIPSFGGALAPFQQIATEIAARHPVVSEGEVLFAARQLGRDRLDRLNRKPPDSVDGLFLPVASIWLRILTGVGVLSFLFAFFLPSGLIARLFGAALVTERGTEITRLRAIGRLALGWAPIMVLQALPRPASLAFETHATLIWIVVVASCVLMVIGTCWAIKEPARGLHDRLARTWLVPR